MTENMYSNWVSDWSNQVQDLETRLRVVKIERDLALKKAYDSGVSIAELSRRSGISRQAVMKIVKGPQMANEIDSMDPLFDGPAAESFAHNGNLYAQGDHVTLGRGKVVYEIRGFTDFKGVMHANLSALTSTANTTAVLDRLKPLDKESL